MKTKVWLSAVLVLLLTSCAKEVKKNFTIKDVQLVAEGPLFDGPNTLMAVYNLDLASIDPAITAENITSVKLINATISTTDSIGFDRIRNVVFQMTSNDAGIQQLALLNPMPKGIKTTSISPSANIDAVEIFREKELTFILDADLEGDMEGNLECSGNFEFEFTFKQ